MSRKRWGQLELTGIQEGVVAMLSSVSNGLTIVGFVVSLLAFGIYILLKNIDSVFPRLLGVIPTNFQIKLYNHTLTTSLKHHEKFFIFLERSILIT